ncbi:hypothetical protein BDM02DRAFT_2452153 [Thelephora ganbajun]|uniref:Uncharacterized protein n=1 Tax=Thelephora ganbajun TaxID=370292 RepID=A0ACB6ZEN1_THEGA|nr:hypothetical protein BDM02DRAFT_2452153 [Thelephora ganbajun]
MLPPYLFLHPCTFVAHCFRLYSFFCLTLIVIPSIAITTAVSSCFDFYRLQCRLPFPPRAYTYTHLHYLLSRSSFFGFIFLSSSPRPSRLVSLFTLSNVVYSWVLRP